MTTPMLIDDELVRQYTDLWRAAQDSFSQGRVDIDPILANRAHDRRRGLSLIVRPGPTVATAVAHLLGQLVTCEPDQHYYRPTELHVTVLSLFTATPAYEPYFRRLPVYRTAIESAVASVGPFSIRFAGVTASAGAVMVQGFPDADQLNYLRDRVRQAFAEAGFAEDLDRRYRITTAHMTIMRFRQKARSLPGLLSLLEGLRTFEFGTTAVREIHLVDNDWYMSEDRVQVLARYPLEMTT